MTDVTALIEGLRDTARWIRAKSRLATNYLYCVQAADALEALSTPMADAALPEGMVAVPRDPTETMLQAGAVAAEPAIMEVTLGSDFADCEEQWRADQRAEAATVWTAMIAASEAPATLPLLNGGEK